MADSFGSAQQNISEITPQHKTVQLLGVVWPETVPIPPWVAERPTPQMFHRFLQAGDYQSAWLTLNSAEWSLQDARTAISQLATAAEDDTFAILTDAWLAASNLQAGGY